MTVLSVALVFKLWMIFDASRRRVPSLWYLALIAPLGDVVYFFTVKLRAFDPKAAEAARPSRPSGGLEALEHEAAQTPSFRNRVRLAWALLDAGDFERAAFGFEQALLTHAHDREASFGLGLARLEQNEYAAAIRALRAVVERSFAYNDYDAALALADATFLAGETARSFELFEAVVAQSRRLEHRLLLARYRLRAGDRERASATLRAALSAFERQDESARRREGAVATEARRLLRTLQPSAR